jgi:hypothetical protein
MAEIDDKEWLDLLAGRFVDVNNPHQKRNADALRAAIKKIDAENLAQIDGLNKIISRMTAEGLFVDKSQISAGNRIILFAKKIRLLIIFILGLAAGLLAPMQVATRGGGEPSILNRFSFNVESETINNELIRVYPNPAIKSQEIVSSAVAAGLVVTISSSNQEIHLLIKGFKKMNPNFTAVNSILEISNQTEGNLAVTIKAK